jgi:hypothetical protein
LKVLICNGDPVPDFCSVVFAWQILLPDRDPADLLAGGAQQFIPGHFETHRLGELGHIISCGGGKHLLAQSLIVLHPSQKGPQLFL